MKPKPKTSINPSQTSNPESRRCDDDLNAKVPDPWSPSPKGLGLVFVFGPFSGFRAWGLGFVAGLWVLSGLAPTAIKKDYLDP